MDVAGWRGAAPQTFAPGGKNPRAATANSREKLMFR